MNTKTEERLSKKDIMELYQINRKTFETWVVKYKLPIIVISDKRKFVRISDLKDWENSRITSNVVIVSKQSKYK
jgi:predicted site-specific integrase-resolvase